VLDETGKRVASFHFLRQQGKKGKDVPNRSLADYLHPNQVDYLGCFAVTAGLGMETKLAEFKAAGDDYNDILFKALADRLAEAATEYVHEQVRTKYWGHSTSEKLDNEALIKEEYLGIRPAPGYPACPEHSEKVTISEILDLENTVGITLTSSYAMYPTSSVSGFFFAHPESSYFGLGKIGEDQVASYATRKGITLQEAERLLSPNLAYSPTPILENSIL
jgi:5-methyltetrahydrofolate--homocysteine methyltransferase